MKKFIISIAVLLPLFSCSMFKLDNYEGPNAEVTGKLLDVVTGEMVSLEAAMSQVVATNQVAAMNQAVEMSLEAVTMWRILCMQG